jgi:hypothetical protein
LNNRQFTTTLGPIISAACALLVVLGATQPWQRTFYIATNGTETNQGFFCLILGVIAIAICLGRAFAHLPRTPYLLGAFIVGVIALGLSGWFLYDLKHAAQGSFFGVEFAITEASSGIYLTIGGAIALLISLFAQLLIPNRRPVRLEASQPPAAALSE